MTASARGERAEARWATCSSIRYLSTGVSQYWTSPSEGVGPYGSIRHRISKAQEDSEEVVGSSRQGRGESYQRRVLYLCLAPYAMSVPGIASPRVGR
eukprot:1780012-Rhodomonas_salina.1